MSSYLTSGQLAKLMHISTSQLRYFEKKELIGPSHVNKNNYRMYDMDKVYQLSHILMLREMDLPINAIKDLLESGTKEDYIQVLIRANKDVTKRINDLTQLRRKVKDLIALGNHLDAFSEEYSFKSYDDRYLKILKSFPIKQMPSILDYYEFMEEFSYLRDHQICEICVDNTYLICKLGRKGDIHLPKGEYLVYQGISREEDDLDEKILNLKSYARQIKKELEGHLIIAESTNLSLFDPHSIYVELQMLIKT